MDNAVNERIVGLLKSRNVDEVEAAKLIGKDKSTMYRITGNKSIPSKTTIKLIAEALDADYHYLLTGQTQLPKVASASKDVSNPWKDEAYAMLKRENERLWQMVQHFTGGAKPNFRKALEHAYSFKYLPGMATLATNSGAKTLH